MGGLAAALRLSRAGLAPRLLEARSAPGGLASGFEAGGLRFDGGPYILLDRPGLEWAFRVLGLVLDEEVSLRRVEDVYEVASEGGPTLRFHADLDATAAGFDALWPGSGRRYAGLVAAARAAYARLQPLLFVSRPGLLDVLRSGAWREAGFLLRSLRSVLARAQLPLPLAQAVAIWTQVAGQRIAEAPSFMAFVPALIHGVGAFYPGGGIGAVPEALARAASKAGVSTELGTSVRAILWRGDRVTGVETDSGAVLEADAIVSDAGLATYLDLLRPALPGLREALGGLPLQSPGVCAYMRVSGPPRPPYLRFRIGGDGACRLFVATGVVEPREPPEGHTWPARLMAPLDHALAEQAGPEGQREHLEGLLAEGWWRDAVAEAEVVATRLPSAWGAEFRLHRDAMNPVMTARFMRAGRLAHRSPFLRGLYLAGSATHPGQWVSFCAISGVLAAERLLEDLV
jgi:phytoene desaturase